MGVAKFFNPRLRARLMAGDVPGWLQRHCRRRYITSVILSTPPWVDQKELRKIREEAKRRSLETGFPHVTDHIIPMNHTLVCGLTVPWNLQIITLAQNTAKSNRWDPDQLSFDF